MIKNKEFINKLGKFILMLLLYVVTSVIVVSIIDYWFLYRFVHDGHYWAYGIPADTCSLLRFLLIRVHQDNTQSDRYVMFLLVISIINYTLINVGLYDCKDKKHGALRFLSKYFVAILFIIANLRFFGDMGNFNIDKTGLYFIFVAIPTYIQLMAFCVVFFIVLKSTSHLLILNKVYSVFVHGVGKIIIYLSILYLTFYTSGCIIKDICFRLDVFPNDFFFIDKSIKSIISKFCFDDGNTIAINLGIILVSLCIYAYIIRRFNIKNAQSSVKGFYFIIKAFTLLMMFASTVRYGSDCLYPTNRYVYDMIINYLYWPLMLSCIFMLLTLRYKNKLLGE